MALAQSARIKGRKATYPANHRPAMEVPKGGSSCSTCRYVTKDLLNCGNKHFILWHGTPKLPYPADEYCSDWYEPAKGVLE
jgi:hypothetical protein